MAYHLFYLRHYHTLARALARVMPDAGTDARIYWRDILHAVEREMAEDSSAFHAVKFRRLVAGYAASPDDD